MSSCITEFFFNNYKHQFDNVVATLKREGPEAAGTCQKGMGPKKQISDKAHALVKDLAVSPVRHNAITLQNATQAWISRLRHCSEVHR